MTSGCISGLWRYFISKLPRPNTDFILQVSHWRPRVNEIPLGVNFRRIRQKYLGALGLRLEQQAFKTDPKLPSYLNSVNLETVTQHTAHRMWLYEPPCFDMEGMKCQQLLGTGRLLVKWVVSSSALAKITTPYCHGKYPESENKNKSRTFSIMWRMACQGDSWENKCFYPDNSSWSICMAKANLPCESLIWVM